MKISQAEVQYDRRLHTKIAYFIVLIYPKQKVSEYFSSGQNRDMLTQSPLSGGCFNPYCTCYFGVIYWEWIGHLTKEKSFGLSHQKTVPSASKQKEEEEETALCPHFWLP